MREDNGGKRKMPVLETSRLVLRGIEKEYAEAMFAGWCADPRVAIYTAWEVHADIDETRGVIEQWLRLYDENDGYFLWAITVKETGEMIGTIDVCQNSFAPGTCEFGYALARKFWNGGIATEATRAVIEHMFARVGSLCVRAKHDSRNPASGRVMQKCGMSLDGTMRRIMPGKDGRLADEVLYSILPEEWEVWKRENGWKPGM